MDVTAALIAATITVGALTPSDPMEIAESATTPASITMTSETPATHEQVPVIRQASLSVPSSKRPAPLIPLYTSLGILQGLDIYTTSAAMSRGAVEANPVMKSTAGKTWTSVAVKAAATAGTVYFIERAWKHNRKGAVILATVINVATAAVVAHNSQVATQR
jgi:hypothetical protein